MHIEDIDAFKPPVNGDESLTAQPKRSSNPLLQRTVNRNVQSRNRRGTDLDRQHHPLELALLDVCEGVREADVHADDPSAATNFISHQGSSRRHPKAATLSSRIDTALSEQPFGRNSPERPTTARAVQQGRL
jgi:hypothetical protein